MPKATHARTLEKNLVFTVEENFKASALPPTSCLIVLIVRTDRSTAHAGDATENHANTLVDVQAGIRSQRKLHPLGVFALPYHLSHAHVQLVMDTKRHRQALCSRFFAHTLPMHAEISQAQSRSPKLRQVLMVCMLSQVFTTIDHCAVEIFELG